MRERADEVKIDENHTDEENEMIHYDFDHVELIQKAPFPYETRYRSQNDNYFRARSIKKL